MLNLKAGLARDIETGIAEAAAAGDLPRTEKETAVVVQRSEQEEYGDYASPVALGLAKAVQKSPMDVAAAIAKHMPKKEYLGKMVAVEPGFLNMWLNPGWLTARLDDVVEQELCSSITNGRGRSANLEYISANPTGPLTMGNIRTAFSADTLANVLECAGYNVTREYYVNDAGEQIRKLGESVVRRAVQASLTQGAKGGGEETSEYPEDLYQGEYIKDIAATIAERWREDEGKEFTKADLENKEMLGEVSEEAMSLLLTDIKRTVEEDLGIHFDIWTSEKKLQESGAVERVLEKLKDRDEIYTKEGAQYLRTSGYGDEEDRVLVKKNGEYAYIAPDIAYHQEKYERGYDLIFTFVGADHQGHLPKLRAAMEALGNDVSKLHLIAAQWVRFMRAGKPVTLSKRAGEIFTPKELIEEVGRDAARFFMVQHGLSSHMDFDLDLAKEQSERNPVYYVQYAYVRLQSILRRAKEEGVIKEVGEKFDLSSSSALTHTFELRLMKEMYRWPEVVAEVAQTHAVQQLPYYSHDLARAVHVFYKHVPVLKAGDSEMTRSRLQLVLAARGVLGKTLDLLGISKPDVM